MAELSQRSQEHIAKSSTVRLRSQLVCSELDVGAVTRMERTELKASAAQIEAEKNVLEEARQKGLPEDEEVLSGERKSYEFEVMKVKMELRKMELDVEREAREADRERERELRRMELEKQKLETEIQLAELRTQGGAAVNPPDLALDTTQDGVGVTRAPGFDNSLAGRTKRFGDTLMHVLPHMPSEHAEIPQFFDTVEKLFHIYEVPDDIQAKLLIPLLSSQAKAIIGRMTSTDLESCDKVKQFLLSKSRLFVFSE